MQRLMGVFFGLLLIAFGVGVHWMVGSTDVCTVEAEGTVIGYQETTDDEGGKVYYPIIQYKYGNRLYEEQANVGSGKKSYADGAKLLIYINPDNPYEFYIDGSTNIFAVVSWGLIILGIIFVISEVIKFLRFGFGSGGGRSGNLVTDFGLISLIIMLIRNHKEKQNSQDEQTLQ